MASAIEDYHAKKIALEEAEEELRELVTRLRAIADLIGEDPAKLLRSPIRFPVGTTEEDKQKTVEEILAGARERIENFPHLMLMPTDESIKAAITGAQLAKAKLQAAFSALSEIEKHYVRDDLSDVSDREE